MSESNSLPPEPSSEQVLWQGSPSQWQNFWWWLSCLLVLPIPFAIWKCLALRCTQITLTSQRLKIRTGVLNKQMEEIELYRVKDWTTEEPFLQRLVNKGSIRMETSDRTAPTVNLRWIDGTRQFSDILRQAVETIRDRKRVREVDFQDDDAGDIGS